MLFIQSPDRLDFCADFWGAKFLDSLTDVLVPKGSHHSDSGWWKPIHLPRSKYNNVGLDFTSVVEKRTRFVESLEFGAALDLDLTVNNHRTGPDV